MSGAVVCSFPKKKRTEQLSEIYEPIRSQLDEVRERISYIAESDLSLLHDGLQLITERTGKLLRPALVLFSHQAADGTNSDVVELAAAAEMIHLASLFHDDVLDHADQRRGHPTLNKRWGNKLPVLVGDFVYSSAILRLQRLFPRPVLEPLAESVQTMTMGEILQNVTAQNTPMTRELYFSIIEKKTAALMAACMRSGALLGEGGEDRIPFLERFGWHMGMAFQIMDDLLDWTGDPILLGKDPLADLREGKVTLPLILFAEKSKAGWHNDENLKKVCKRMKDEGVFHEVKKMADEHIARAKTELRILPQTRVRQALERLADFVVDRKN